MKTVIAENYATSFFLPAQEILACFHAKSNEETRYYLQGVYVQAMTHADAPEIESLCAVATDGHVMLHCELPERAFIGADVSTQSNDSARTRGFILDFDVMEKALKAKSKSGELWLYGDTDTGIIQVVDLHQKAAPSDPLARMGVLEFTRVDGSYPDWSRVMPKESGAGVSGCIFDPALLARLAKAGNLLSDHKSARVELTQAKTGDPMRVKFSGAPALTGVMMPCRFLD